MDIKTVIRELRQELELIDQAILSLELIAPQSRMEAVGSPAVGLAGTPGRSGQKVRAKNPHHRTLSDTAPPA